MNRKQRGYSVQLKKNVIKLAYILDFESRMV